MTIYQERAIELFQKGYNCAQATLAPFADAIGMDNELLLKMSTAFGGGFAKTRATCGAISAIGFVVGLTYTDSKDPRQSKTDVYRITRRLTDKFIAIHNTLNCAELLNHLKNVDFSPSPQERTPEYYKERPCAMLVVDAVKIIEDYLIEIGLIQE